MPAPATVRRGVGSWVPRKESNEARGLRLGYRSGLERSLGSEIAAVGQPVLFETFRVPYAIPAKLHHYTPDFMLANGIIIEGKGIFDATDRAKHLFVKSQYPELDIRFVFSSSRAKISKGSSTTLADWCRKYDYQFADKSIPLAWFNESPGTRRHPREVLKDGPYGFANLMPSNTRRATPR